MTSDSKKTHTDLNKILQLSQCNINEIPDSQHWQSLIHFLNEHFSVIEQHRQASSAGLSQQTLNEAQRIANIGSWTYNHLTDETHWSEQMFIICGLNKNIVSPSYQIFLDCVHPDDKQYLINFHKQALGGQEAYTINYRLLRHDDKIKYVQEHSENAYDDNGEAISSAGTLQDLSEQKHQEEQLRRSQKMQALGSLAGGVAHDFNNLLGVMIGYAELLQLGAPSPEEIKLYAENIITAGNRGAKLARRMLSFSQHDSTETNNCNVNDIVHEEQLMLQKSLTARIELITDLNTDIWQCEINQDDLKDAILNIGINAMHAMPGGGKLIISSQNINIQDIPDDKITVIPGDYVKLSFKDNGIGMDEKTLTQLFDPFFTTKGDKGTGLGMSQVYGFIKRSHGAIDVFSKPDQGTEIIFYLPRQHSKNKPDMPPETTTEKYHKKQIRILIVDDEKALCNLISEILKNHAYITFTAHNAEQALELLKTESIDILLSDVVMPKMNGYELAEKVQTLYPAIKIQMMSGYSNNDDVHSERSKQLSKSRLHKPVSGKALLKAIREQLRTANPHYES